MRDIGGNQEHDIRQAGYFSFALEVIDRFARRIGGGEDLKRDVLERLTVLTIQSGSGAIEGLLRTLRSERITANQAITLYIPEIARVLGRGWEDDRFSFAEVTIGCARLQDLLHQLHGDLTADSSDGNGSKAVLVLVPAGEQHTLGALIVATELRQRGVSVNIQIGPALSDLSRLMASRHFDAVLVSVANTEKVDIAAKLIKTIKSITKGRMRVALGGPGTTQMPDALVSSEVDIITDNLELVVSTFALQRHEREAGLARG